MRELQTLLTELVGLIKAQELERAEQLVRSARQQQMAQGWLHRQQTVHQATLALHELQLQRQRLLQLAELQPEPIRWHTRQRLEALCRELLDPVQHQLQAQKRAFSQARSLRGRTE